MNVKEQVLKELRSRRAGLTFDALAYMIANDIDCSREDVKNACKELWESEEIDQFQFCDVETPIKGDTLFRLC